VNRAIFLDRDGVLNKKPPEHDYVKKVSELEILPGVREAVDLIKQSGYLAIVITNQRGVARGMMTRDDVRKIHMILNKKLDGKIDAFYVCYHEIEEDCECRKPKPGMVLRAAERWKIDLKRSWMIGDSEKDMETAKNAGVAGLKMETDGDLGKAVGQILKENGAGF
jgi:D-glycero-D-manno-heptose 1,7-bisphosphate phosphatase